MLLNNFEGFITGWYFKKVPREDKTTSAFSKFSWTRSHHLVNDLLFKTKTQPNLTQKEMMAAFAKRVGFPGDPVVRNLPPNAGHTDLTPGLERSLVQESHLHAVGQLSRLYFPRWC